MMHVAGIDIAYERIGHGPLVVLIGGIDMDASVWKRTYANAFVKEGFEVLMINLRGMPPSTATDPPYSVEMLAEDCQQLLAKLEINECFIVGASLGAFVAQELLLKYPEGKRAAALVATAVRQTEWVKMLTRAELELYASSSSLPLDYLIASDLLQLFTPEELCDDEFVRKMTFFMKTKDHTAKGRQGLLSAVANYEGCIDRLHTLVVPTMFISFSEDVLTPALLVRRASSLALKSQYVEIAECGHSAIYAKSERVASEILAHFTKIAAPIPEHAVET